MKTTALLLVVVLAGCASVHSPFTPSSAQRVSAIRVGMIPLCDADPFADEPEDEPARPVDDFQAYFTITNEIVVAKLRELIVQMDKSDEFIPMIGVLCDQQWLGPNGRIVGETCIVNFANTVVVGGPQRPREGGPGVGMSEEFCRTIYDLMLKHCPEEIERQRAMYRQVERRLETLLFQGKDIEEPAQQNGGRISSEGAPSAPPNESSP